MKLTVVLVLFLVTAAAAGPAPQSHVTDGRQQRLFLTGYPSPLTGLTGLLGLTPTTVTVSKTPSVPKIIYVQKAPPTAGRSCQTPYVATGCPAGYVCSPGWQCVPLKQLGESCTAGYQCVVGTCRQNHCVRDVCLTAGQQSSCPSGQTCVSTGTGRVCRPKDDSCSPSLDWADCPTGQYCGKDGHCQPKLPVNEICEKALQCQHNICRNRRCKNDACPTIHSSIDCDSTQYCASSTNGNVCKDKLANGKMCKSDDECQSLRCENDKCVLHECLNDNDCLSHPHQYCQQGQQGRRCREKVDKGAECRMSIMCKSGKCIKGHCFEDECNVPMSSNECSLNQICMSTRHGYTCMMKLQNNAPCTSNMHCLSNFCSGSFCRPQPPVTTSTTPSPSSSSSSSPPTSGSTTSTTTTTTTTTTTATPLKDVGAICDAPAECTSGRCVNGRCLVPRNGNRVSCSGENAAGNNECRSLNCVEEPADSGTYVCLLGDGAAGAACSDDLQCAQAMCEDGICL